MAFALVNQTNQAPWRRSARSNGDSILPWPLTLAKPIIHGH